MYRRSPTWPLRVVIRPPVARLCRSHQEAWQRQPVTTQKWRRTPSMRLMFHPLWHEGKGKKAFKSRGRPTVTNKRDALEMLIQTTKSGQRNAQQWVADEVGVHRSMVRRWAQGFENSDSSSDAQIPDLYTSSASIAWLNLSTTTAIQGLAERVQLPDFADPIEDFTEEDSNSESMSTGRSPKQPRTEPAENGLDIAALLEKVAEKAGDRAAEKAGDRAAEKSAEGFRKHAEGFRTYMDTKIDSMMEQMDKKDR